MMMPSVTILMQRDWLKVNEDFKKAWRFCTLVFSSYREFPLMSFYRSLSNEPSSTLSTAKKL
jgi:hypothetical protein